MWFFLLCRDLLSGRKIAAAFRAGKDLVRIAPAFGIEDAAQGSHRVQIVSGKLLFHEIDLLDTNPMLTRDAATEFDALFQNIGSGGDRSAYLISLSLVVQD